MICRERFTIRFQTYEGVRSITLTEVYDGPGTGLTWDTILAGVISREWTDGHREASIVSRDEMRALEKALAPFFENRSIA